MTELFEEKWQMTEAMLTKRFGKKPDLEAILFLIGIQELGAVKKKFTKEQKQDLMHIAVCTLLSQSGYYEPEGRDRDGWPHFKRLIPVPEMGLEEQEKFLKEHIVEYFESRESL